MRRRFSWLGALFCLAAIAGALGGCGDDKGSGVQLDPNVRPAKPPEQMTKEEKIAEVEKSPMPPQAKQKRIADIQAGRA